MKKHKLPTWSLSGNIKWDHSKCLKSYTAVKGNPSNLNSEYCDLCCDSISWCGADRSIRYSKHALSCTQSVYTGAVYLFCVVCTCGCNLGTYRQLEHILHISAHRTRREGGGQSWSDDRYGVCKSALRLWRNAKPMSNILLLEISAREPQCKNAYRKIKKKKNRLVMVQQQLYLVAAELIIMINT